ncbi:MAG TPA: hypothetical protein PK954_24730 [Anaerolineales bacterium]|nr:hypothetical protein [Anaerolineales bacterium]
MTPSLPIPYRLTSIAATFTALMTVIAFALALIAVPISGANCPAGCVAYPYLDTLGQFPRDFLWMGPAMLLILGYTVLITALHAAAIGDARVYSQIALSIALISATILLADYFIQLSVVPVSLSNGETHGLPLLIQYNPHGVFLVLEELGYLLMSLSFPFAGLAIPSRSRLARVARWIFIAAFGLVVLAFVVVSMLHGLERLDRFEVLAISIDWLTLIVNGILLGLLFGRPVEPRPRLAAT